MGLTTSITKEYATMITVGATANGYVPGEEATAFSKWNVGIEDRFKRSLKDADNVRDKDPKIIFKNDNKGVIENYNKYINQSVESIIGINRELIDPDDDPETKNSFESKTLTPNPKLITSNTAAVTNFYKYLQASSSLANIETDNPVESSVGFLPFNLSLEMDGLSGFKIYNKLEVNTKFLPSNYNETMEFVITGVDHKLSNNEWTTNLSTIGTSIGTTKPSTIGKIIMGKFNDFSQGVSYKETVKEEDLQKPGAYIIKNLGRDGGEGRRYKFEDLGAHWEADYTKYIRDEKMRRGQKSVLVGNENIVVYDLVLWSQVSDRTKVDCWIPSPIKGFLGKIASGSDSVTTIHNTKDNAINKTGYDVKMLHMDVVFGNTGDKIEKGAVIGRQGQIMTARPENYHLHIQCKQQVLENYVRDLVKEGASKSRPTSKSSTLYSKASGVNAKKEYPNIS